MLDSLFLSTYIIFNKEIPVREIVNYSTTYDLQSSQIWNMTSLQPLGKVLENFWHN